MVNVFSREELVAMGKNSIDIKRYTFERRKLWVYNVELAKRKIYVETGLNCIYIRKVYSHIFNTMVVYILDHQFKPLCEYHHDDPLEGLKRCVNSIVSKKRGRDITDLCDELEDMSVSSKRRKPDGDGIHQLFGNISME